MKKLIFCFSMAAMALCTGCSNDNDLSTASKDSSMHSLSVTSASVSEAKSVTKSSSYTPLAAGNIGVFRSADNGYTALNDVEFTYGTPWTTTTPINLGSATTNVCAYYPYDASITNSAAVPLTSQVYSTAADLCYSTNTTVNNTAPQVAFNMLRAYSMITFNITRNTTYEGTASPCQIGNISIANVGLQAATTLDITSGTYATGTLGTVTFAAGISAIAIGTSQNTAALMVPVSGLTGNITFSFVVDGTAMTQTVDATTFGLTALAPANNYKISVTISGKGLVINSVNLQDWADQTISSPIDFQ